MIQNKDKQSNSYCSMNDSSSKSYVFKHDFVALNLYHIEHYCLIYTICEFVRLSTHFTGEWTPKWKEECVNVIQIMDICPSPIYILKMSYNFYCWLSLGFLLILFYKLFNISPL